MLRRPHARLDAWGPISAAVLGPLAQTLERLSGDVELTGRDDASTSSMRIFPVPPLGCWSQNREPRPSPPVTPRPLYSTAKALWVVSIRRHRRSGMPRGKRPRCVRWQCPPRQLQPCHRASPTLAPLQWPRRWRSPLRTWRPRQPIRRIARGTRRAPRGPGSSVRAPQSRAWRTYREERRYQCSSSQHARATWMAKKSTRRSSPPDSGSA